MDYAAVLEAGLRTSGLTAAEASRRAVGNAYFLYGILRKGHIPSVEKFESLCDVLGIEFSVGLTRSGNDPPVDRPSDATPGTTTNAPASPSEAALDPAGFASDVKEAVRDQMAAILRSEAESIRREVCEGINEHLHALQGQAIPPRAPPANDLEDAGALVYLGDGFGETQESRQVEIVQYSAAAGGGAEEAEERVVGMLAFCRQWMDRHALRPGNCAVIDVRGESMEPTLWDGASILFNRSRDEWRPGDIFVIRIPNQGLVVKRAGEDDEGNWLLLSDNDSPGLAGPAVPRRCRDHRPGGVDGADADQAVGCRGRRNTTSCSNISERRAGRAAFCHGSGGDAEPGSGRSAG